MTNPNGARSPHPRKRHLSSGEEPTEKEREYLEVIYYLAARNEPVIAARLARWMGVQPPTVTVILRHLEEKKKLITRSAHGEITFTPEGFALAEAMVRRHRILERFLVDVIGMEWHQIHEEAVRLEHALSPAMEERITALVGDSATCPHGNPIPGNAEGYEGGTCLIDALAGRGFVIKRIVEEAEENIDLIRYLQSNGMVPGSEFAVGDVSPSFGVTLQRPGQTITVSAEIAGLLWGEIL
ncbi:metal-dependent transcriptional regulator [Chloroflexales bacterium ZM16-3]|nr:metal-dependent transcriptional regulator [Chloroflexales bacterium ZM16-3]